jgi:hypothetical protein
MLVRPEGPFPTIGSGFQESGAKTPYQSTSTPPSIFSFSSVAKRTTASPLALVLLMDHRFRVPLAVHTPRHFFPLLQLVKRLGASPARIHRAHEPANIAGFKPACSPQTHELSTSLPPVFTRLGAHNACPKESSGCLSKVGSCADGRVNQGRVSERRDLLRRRRRISSSALTPVSWDVTTSGILNH